MSELRAAAVRRTADPSLLAATAAEQEEDVQIAATAAVLAMQRHVGRSRVVVGPDGRRVERTGTDLREVGLLVGSGGVLRHATPDAVRRIIGALVGTLAARLAAARARHRGGGPATTCSQPSACSSSVVRQQPRRWHVA